MDNKNRILINCIIYVIAFLSILTYESMIINPGFMANNYYNDYLNPQLYNKDNMIYIYFSGFLFYHDIYREIINNQTFCEYSSPYILIRTENTNNPLFLYSYGYKISISDKNCHSNDINGFIFPLDTKVINYINETEYFPPINYDTLDFEEITGLRCLSLDNERIVYGKTDQTAIIFLFS